MTSLPSMICADPDFVVPAIPENEKYEGTVVDPNILKALPAGATMKWASVSVASFWAYRGRIDTIFPSGEERSYFLKIYTADRAEDIAHGEFESTNELSSIIPDNVPKVVAHGPCADHPGRAFFLSEYCNMEDKLPSTDELVSLVAAIHSKTSPNGKFGYHTTTFAGKHAINTTWCDTWEEFFTRCMKDTMLAELAVQGPNAELEELSEQILSKVIPRLVRPMETGGRKITPVLVHGDLWHGNVSVGRENGRPVVYDPCCFYGHNEYDFSMWRASRYHTNQEHVKAYFGIIPPSEPREDRDDRNALYALRSDLAVSTLWPDVKTTRMLAMEEMRRLVSKYGDGYEGYLAAQSKEDIIKTF